MGEDTDYAIAIMIKQCLCWRKHIWYLPHLSYLFEANLGVSYTADNTHISHWGSQWICPEECSDTDRCWAWETMESMNDQETHCWRKTAVHQVQPQHFKAIAVLLDRVHEVQERSLTLPDRAPSRTSNPSETQWCTAGLSWCVNCWVSKDDTHFPLFSHTFR